MELQQFTRVTEVAIAVRVEHFYAISNNPRRRKGQGHRHNTAEMPTVVVSRGKRRTIIATRCVKSPPAWIRHAQDVFSFLVRRLLSLISSVSRPFEFSRRATT